MAESEATEEALKYHQRATWNKAQGDGGPVLPDIVLLTALFGSDRNHGRWKMTMGNQPTRKTAKHTLHQC